MYFLGIIRMEMVSGWNTGRYERTERSVRRRSERVWGYETSKKKAKSKAPHVNPTCGPPRFVLGFNRPGHPSPYSSRDLSSGPPILLFRALVVQQLPSLLGRRSRRRHLISPKF